jgi:hypothetical protein
MARNAFRFHPHARVLHAAFISGDDNQPPRHKLTVVARLMGVPYTTLHDYCTNTASMPIDLVGPLYAATRDLKLISDLLGLADVGLTLSEDPAAGDADSVRAQTLRLGASAGQVQSAVLAALEDNHVDDLEAKRIANAIEDLERQGETLRKATKRKAGR